MDVFKPLTERQQYILGLVVRSYIEDGAPVGSKTVVTRFDLDVSSATVRNELALLDQLGYLGQLHTSGGRVPTELGFRYFVHRLMGEIHLPRSEQQMIKHQFHQADVEIQQWLRLAAAVLARISHGASFVTAPRTRFTRFKHVQLISTQGRLVLLIVVLSGGLVRQQMLTLATPLSQERLSIAANRLNAQFEGRNMDELEARLLQHDELEQDITRLVIEMMRSLDARSIGHIYRDGLANLIDHSETRQAIRLLEEHSLLSNVLSEFNAPEATGVQVVIGGEGRWEELKDCTMILSRYGVDEDMIGEVAVVGPMRMPYGRNISAVRYVSDIMSGFVNEYYAQGSYEETTGE